MGSLAAKRHENRILFFVHFCASLWPIKLWLQRSRARFICSSTEWFRPSRKQAGEKPMTPLFAFFGFGGPELIIVNLIVGLMLMFSAIPAVLAFLVLSRIPGEFRKQEPGLAFLLLIPCFSIIWAFFVHPKVADSLKSYFEAKGIQGHGDCGASIALWICICGACSFVPVAGAAAGLAGLVLLIVFYVKAFELSGTIPQNA
jgi:hypothetical protein